MKPFLQLALALATLLLAACASEPPADEAAAPPGFVFHTPLPVDPTERHEMTGWWASPTAMLRLDSEGSYALWDGANRYHPPAQRGRWSQPNYASLRLEPYERLRTPPRRVDVVKVDGRVALVLGDGPPLDRTAGPPAVLEDRLLGTWRAADADLALDESGRYRLSPRPGAGRAGHSGDWRLDGRTVILEPDTPGLDALALAVTRQDDDLALDAESETFTRGE